jgi:hypothetical protein
VAKATRVTDRRPSIRSRPPMTLRVPPTVTAALGLSAAVVRYLGWVSFLNREQLSGRSAAPPAGDIDLAHKGPPSPGRFRADQTPAVMSDRREPGRHECDRSPKNQTIMNSCPSRNQHSEAEQAPEDRKSAPHGAGCEKS